MQKKKTQTKGEFIQAISKQTKKNPEEVRTIIQAFLDRMSDSLFCDQRIEFRHFGVFEKVFRNKKIGRNPRQPDHPIIIPAHYSVKFTPSKKMKQLMASRALLTASIDHNMATNTPKKDKKNN